MTSETTMAMDAAKFLMLFRRLDPEQQIKVIALLGGYKFIADDNRRYLR